MTVTQLTPSQKPHTFFGHARKGPGPIRRAANYVGAVVRYRRNHGWRLPLELAQPRHATCQTNRCGKYDAKIDRCLHRKCGCSLAEKVTWSTEQCPEEYWLPVFGPAPLNG